MKKYYDINKIQQDLDRMHMTTEETKQDLLHRLDIIISQAENCKRLIKLDETILFNDELNSCQYNMALEANHFSNVCVGILRIKTIEDCRKLGIDYLSTEPVKKPQAIIITDETLDIQTGTLSKSAQALKNYLDSKQFPNVIE